MLDEEVETLFKAFKNCDLDCAAWDDSVLRELAVLAIETLDKYHASMEGYSGGPAD